jgi:hypothetical protein
VAKQLEFDAQSNGSENVDWEVQLPAYQNEELRLLDAATALVQCWEEHLANWQLFFQETEVAIGCHIITP